MVTILTNTLATPEGLAAVLLGISLAIGYTIGWWKLRQACCYTLTWRGLKVHGAHVCTRFSVTHAMCDRCRRRVRIRF
jgi:hypothetical protein